jgi:glycosyltransferase involved in cell wall biosynthesis
MKVDYYLGVEPDATTRMLLQGHFFKWYEVVAPNLDAKVISIPNGADFRSRIKRKLFQWTALPLAIRRRRDSLLHIISVNLVNDAISLMAGSPLIVTCFDAIIYEDNAEQLAKKRTERVLSAHRRVMKKADRVITISKHARNRIASVCEIDQGKIDVVYLAVDHDAFYPRQIEKTREMVSRFGFAPDRKNILYVGSESPRKNLELIIQALSLVREQINIRFVKVGVPLEPYHSRLLKLVRQLKLGDVVCFRAPVRMEELPIMYNLADLFVFPSLYEGFGLPPLEAMASGCSVVASSTTSLPEVIGDAAEIVDPFDHRSIADGILRVLSDEQYRQWLIKKGREQALQFSWKKTAAGILDVYRKLL